MYHRIILPPSFTTTSPSFARPCRCPRQTSRLILIPVLSFWKDCRWTYALLRWSFPNSIYACSTFPKRIHSKRTCLLFCTPHILAGVRWYISDESLDEALGSNHPTLNNLRDVVHRSSTTQYRLLLCISDSPFLGHFLAAWLRPWWYWHILSVLHMLHYKQCTTK